LVTATNGARENLHGLYVIIDPVAIGERDELQVARQAIEGRVRLLQWRDKRREKGMQLPVAEALRHLCEERGAFLIVNDHVDLAVAAGAHGVHVGQRDLPVPVVRLLTGRAMIIGCSTNNPEEARQAEADGADYVSVGRLFPTGTKLDTRPATLDTLRAVRAAVSVPVCAIGGINESNIDDVLAAGADMASVTAAVVAAANVREAASRLATRFPG
jgi:thiamine-phosphate pyrophosphorylase